MTAKIINFFAGPSAGKSTMALGVTHELKKLRLNVEYVPEYAKDLTWQKSPCLDDQVYVFGQQFHRLYTLVDQVDYIVTDSPLFLSAYYFDLGMNKWALPSDLRREFKVLVRHFCEEFNNLNFFVERGNRKFVQQGRNQDEEGSKKIDKELQSLLDRTGWTWFSVNDVSKVMKVLNVS